MQFNNIRRYSINELAERWNCLESHIIHLIEDRYLPIYAKSLLVTSRRPSLINDGDIDIEEGNLLRINRDTVKRAYESAENWNNEYWVNSPFLPKAATITLGDDYLLTDEDIAIAAIDNFIDCFIYQADVEEFELKNGIEKVTQNTEAVEVVSINNSAPDKRESQLYNFIWRVHQALLTSKQKKPTAQQVWNEIQHRHENHDTDKIIQEVDSRQILWISAYENEQRLKRTTFNKTLSNIRKNPPL